MAHYSVYLETGDDGPCMAHVIDLPGCVVRALTRDEALRRLPEAIKEYHAWLRAHGEPVRTSGGSAQIDIPADLRRST
ncbi:MAG: type II toxin-antitoxin system HicB family antitoxin [Anaerolineae bacterium]